MINFSGNLIGATFVSTAADCLLACKDTPGCLWYTANPPLQFCGLYSTCGFINEAQCPECRSGESFYRVSHLLVDWFWLT